MTELTKRREGSGSELASDDLLMRAVDAFLDDEIEEALTKLTHSGILQASGDSLRRG